MRRLMPVLIAAQALCSIGTSCVAANESEDFIIRPGVGIGELRLGMDKTQIKKILGAIDGHYSMPNGMEGEYSQWKEPNRISTVRIFFDGGGKAVQIATEESGSGPSTSKLVTADGVRVGSSPSDVADKYGPLKHFRYRAKDGRIDYADDMKRGIAFEFTWAEIDGEAKRRLYAIIVHKPGKQVLADSDERPVAAR